MDLKSFTYQFRKFFAEIPKVCLLGIRGYKYERDNYNSLGIYDDAIVRHIDGEIKIFSASVDPGRYYINHPINPSGCAKLKSGLWQYRLGEHHTHPALVQAEEVAVDRLDKTGKRVGEENGWFGINLHSGGQEYLVGRYSAGCQVIQSDEPWKFQWLDFFNPIKDSGQKIIPYLLVEALEAEPA